MTRSRTAFVCAECGHHAPKWSGRCGGCGAWNSLTEEVLSADPAPAALLGAAPVALDAVEAGPAVAVPTGLSELDRTLGGGLVPGSVTLVGGEPGIGKSTLLLQLAAEVASAGRRVLYVTGEESPQQVRARADRLGVTVPGVHLLAETAVTAVVARTEELQPDLVLVDSIQTLHDPQLSSAPGSVAQVRACAHRLTHEAKARTISTVLVGHVTKDGQLAGPRVLEHAVDTVMSFEGERHHALRVLRTTKHRFGSTNEIGIFEMTGAGLGAVADASGLFLADRLVGVPGSAVVACLLGHRPVLVEVQALVAPSSLATPRRSAQGVDAGRLSVLLAVLERRAGLALAKSDVFTLAVGGARIAEPSADLGMALAIASACFDRALPSDLVVCGEIGLGGEVRQLAQLERRLAEAARLGFAHALVPRTALGLDVDLHLDPVDNLLDALVAVGLVPGAPARTEEAR